MKHTQTNSQPLDGATFSTNTYVLQASLRLDNNPHLMRTFQQCLSDGNAAIKEIQETMFAFGAESIRINADDERSFAPEHDILSSGNPKLSKAMKRVYEYTHKEEVAKLLKRFCEPTNRIGFKQSKQGKNIILKKILTDEGFYQDPSLDDKPERASAIFLAVSGDKNRCNRIATDYNSQKSFSDKEITADDVKAMLSKGIERQEKNIQLEADIAILRKAGILPLKKIALMLDKLPDDRIKKRTFSQAFEALKSHRTKAAQMKKEIEEKRKETKRRLQLVEKAIGPRLKKIKQIEKKIGYPLHGKHVNRISSNAEELRSQASDPIALKNLLDEIHRTGHGRPGDPALYPHIIEHPELLDQCEIQDGESKIARPAICLYAMANGDKIRADERPVKPIFSFPSFSISKNADNIAVRNLLIENSDGKKKVGGGNEVNYALSILNSGEFQIEIESPFKHTGPLSGGKRLGEMLRQTDDGWQYHLIDDTWAKATVKSITISYIKNRIYLLIPVEVMTPSSRFQFITYETRNTNYLVDKSENQYYGKNSNRLPLLENVESVKVLAFDFGMDRDAVAIGELTKTPLPASNRKLTSVPVVSKIENSKPYYFSLLKVRSIRIDYDRSKPAISKRNGFITRLRDIKNIAGSPDEMIRKRQSVLIDRQHCSIEHRKMFKVPLWGLSSAEQRFQEEDRKLCSTIRNKQRELGLPISEFNNTYAFRKRIERERLRAHNIIQMAYREGCKIIVVEDFYNSMEQTREQNRMLAKMRTLSFAKQLIEQAKKIGIDVLFTPRSNTSRFNPFNGEYGIRAKEYRVADIKGKEKWYAQRLRTVSAIEIEESCNLAIASGKECVLLPDRFGRILIDQTGQRMDVDDAAAVNILFRGMVFRGATLGTGLFDFDFKDKEKIATLRLKILDKIKYLNGMSAKSVSAIGA